MQQLPHFIPCVSNCSTVAISTSVAAASNSRVAGRLQQVDLRTATYKRVRIFVQWAMAAHMPLNAGT